jgi:long-chain acyl-CoA synthetase
MVPTMFIRLMKQPEQMRRNYDVSSPRHVIHAAAPMSARRQARHDRVVGSGDP